MSHPLSECDNERPDSVLLWKSKYAGVSVSDLTRMRELEAENAKLKRMYADLALENNALKDVIFRKW